MFPATHTAATKPMQPGPLMLDLAGRELTARERALLSRPQVGGVILFARNVDNPAQVRELTASIREIRDDLLLAVDQEGGRVQRLRNGYTRFPAMARLGELFTRDPEAGSILLKDSGWLLATEVIASGLDFSFTPVLDVDDHHCEVIADRSFSADPQIAGRAAGLFIEGLREAGMAVTGKHFPGHGGVIGDSHLETPTDPRALADIEDRDLVPFRSLLPVLDAVMPAHIVFPAVDRHCVGFSRRWLQQILRGDLGFDGVIFSDDLSMKGADMAGGYPQKVAAALDAGCDMVLVCNNPPGAEEALAWLEQRNIAPSPRLTSMAARRRPAWEALDGCERRESIRARLAAL